jgi:integrase
VIEPLTPAELVKTLEAAERHDLDLLTPRTGPGQKRKHVPVLPLVVIAILSGARRKEAVELRRDDFDPTVCGMDGVEVGAIKVRKEVGKRGKARTITLDYSPFLARYLRELQLATEPGARLCGITYSQAGVALERLKGEFGAPKSLTWQKLRQTVSCYLTSAPGLFGSASHIQSARRLGHSLKVADQFYLEAIAGLSKDAETLEDAMRITETLRRVCGAASERKPVSYRQA